MRRSRTRPGRRKHLRLQTACGSRCSCRISPGGDDDDDDHGDDDDDDDDDDIYIMMKCMYVCLYVTFLLIFVSRSGRKRVFPFLDTFGSRSKRKSV